jgi:hypothetical protein
MEWLSFSYGMQGELYYETTMAFAGDPWTSQTAFGGSGDGTLFYPGTTARIGGQTEIPVESLRLKAIRDGMEDYELLNLAKSLGSGTQALAIAQGVYPKTYQATSSPAALDSGRAELASLILHALGKDVPPALTGGGSGGGTSTPCVTTACTTSPVSSIATAGFHAGGGCSSSGVQVTWLGIPLLALFGLARRRRAARFSATCGQR